MLFFVNPGGSRKRRAARVARARLDKRRKRRKVQGEPSRNAQSSEQPTMRRRRNSKGRFVKASNPARRRRRRRNPSRSVARLSANPARRRRRRRRNPGAFARIRRANPRHHRRRRRRNPSMGGLVGNIVQDLKNGAGVVLGQVAVRKIRGAVTGMLPAATQTTVATGAGHVALSLAAAITASVAARKFAPGYARYVAAGAMSEVLNGVLATTPIAPFLSAFPRRVPVRVPARGVNAWPAAPAMPTALPAGRVGARSGFAAWPVQAGPTMMHSAGI